jgi:hypothetical protein
MTILVIDDSQETLEGLCRMVEHEHQVLIASDGAANSIVFTQRSRGV